MVHGGQVGARGKLANAIVRQELGGWKWALLQAGGMTVLAYLGAWAAYAALSGA